MRAAISLLVLQLSMCGVHTESPHGTDFSTQDVYTELKELRDMVVELRATLQHTRDDVKVLEADNVAVKQSLATSVSKVEALERALEDTKAEMKKQVDNLMKTNAAQEAELTAVKTRPAATETEVEDLEKEIRAAPRPVAFSASLRESGGGVTESGKHDDLDLVFKRVITNVGQAYSNTTGFFTAPVRGVYYFRFTVMDMLSSRYMEIKMQKNGEKLMQLHDYDTDGEPSYLSSGLTLQLEEGDEVNLVLPPRRRLYDDYSSFSTFSGFLLFPL